MKIKSKLCKKCGISFVPKHHLIKYCLDCKRRKPCKCGCGQLCDKDYKKGHGLKGKHFSEEHKNKIGISNKGKKRSPEVREKIRKISIGRKRTEESKKKFSKIAKENGFGKWMTGKKSSNESKEKLRLARLGKHLSNESKEKDRLAHLGEKNGMYGKNHNEEAIKKISEASKKMWENEEIRKKIMINNTPEKFREMGLKANIKFKDTGIEVKVGSFLKQLNIEYFHNHIINDIEHKYKCDFYIPQHNLIIETDGGYWHNYPYGRELDIIRTKEILNKNYKLIRLWENEIKTMDYDSFCNIVFNKKNYINFQGVQL